MKNTEKGKSKAPSQRQLRVAEEIRHVLAKMLSQDEVFIDGLKPSFVMITQVTISPDLSYATAFVETIGEMVNLDEQIALLNRHKGVFRYKVGKSIRLRIVPDIIFKSDNRFAASKYINDLLNSPQVRADVEKEIEEEEF
ncbi:MAG: 30S ribosome-binding factor RbfA [Alphaproteobacteria bacterium]|nr:30S ribosome-binding factor RbfA [Alphaproteobacteria bacterium]